ncbi:MAG: ATPase domain-containing protein [Candidatus Woesearchaeota archaeon]
MGLIEKAERINRGKKEGISKKPKSKNSGLSSTSKVAKPKPKKTADTVKKKKIKKSSSVKRLIEETKAKAKEQEKADEKTPGKEPEPEPEKHEEKKPEVVFPKKKDIKGPASFDVSKLKDQLAKEIKGQEKDNVDEHVAQLVGDRIVTVRPKGSVEKLKKADKPKIPEEHETSDKQSEKIPNVTVKTSSTESAEDLPDESAQEPAEAISESSQPEEAPAESVAEQPAFSGGIDFSKIKAQVEATLRRKPRTIKKDVSDTPNTRISTGIRGLDEVMGGGFRKGSVNLIAGGPGSGKTIFGMQFLMDGIDRYKENGVIISFEQSEEELLEDMEGFDWDVAEKVKNKQLVVLSYTPEQVEKVLKAGGGTVRDVIESIGAKRVVIDSLTAFTLLHENDLTKRKASLDLFNAIKRWRCTALMLAEHEGNPELHSPTVEEFEVDGVILIYNIRKGDVRERALEIFKMRATKHSAKIFPMVITDDGINIYPDQTVF